MIVTRSWLGEFIDLKDTTDERLFEIFNSIGLEVGRIENISIPAKIVVGKIISCEKHPDANKLNVCTVDVGSGLRQIVCGAANVVDASFVAVATIGAVMPDGLEIKPATLRGVDSEGMICSSTELGLPKINDGIMMLDDSIGILELGKELREYDTLNDTIFEIELTPNRGDCLSILGVARDLVAVLETSLIETKAPKSTKKQKIGISRDATLHISGEVNASLDFIATSSKDILCFAPLLILIRLAIANKQTSTAISAITTYSIHSTGVIMRCYNSDLFKDENNHININLTKNDEDIMCVMHNHDTASMIGINQNIEFMADKNSKSLIIEASYTNPNNLHGIDASLEQDDLYYISSRGSNPSLEIGLIYISMLMEKYLQLEFNDEVLSHKLDTHSKSLVIDLEDIHSIIGQSLDKSKINQILKSLGFVISATKENSFVAIIPSYRHDIENIQDIAEEILRIVGIDKINAKPLSFTEAVHSSSAIIDFRNKNNIRNRSAANGFDEALTYVFSDKQLLEKYNFPLINEKLSLLNPIVNELNTLRSTILINLLLATKNNINYGKKSVKLFEIGSVFSQKRDEAEKIAFIWSGQSQAESIINDGKPNDIQFALFLEKLYGILGAFELLPCSHHNNLIHPYQSADIVVNGENCGYISKLHPTAQDEFGISTTFIAELDIEPFYSKHINARNTSNFQGVYKDLSIVVDKSISYSSIKSCISKEDLALLKSFYPVDIYEDSSLGHKQSLTIRFFIQSNENTLNEEDIISVTNSVLDTLAKKFGATLR
jgi:phenylalanyl-tRNA synthetase beta chain